MDQESIIADIEAKARSAGVSISSVCQQAGVHPTTFSRWKKSPKNPDPIGANMRSVEKIYATLRTINAQSRRRQRASA